MSRIRADKFVNSGANGAPQLTFGAEVVAGVGLTGAGGINITGIATAASFSGATGSFTGDVDIADKIIHTGDTNTAIRFPAADTFTVETGGSEAFRVTGDQRIGIGTADPLRQLEVYNSTDAIINLKSDTQSSVIFSDPADTNIGMLIYEHSSDSMQFRVNDAERARITSAGRFGFNTTSPDYTVDINGELGIKEGQPVTWHDGSGNPAAQIYGDSSSNLIFRTGVAGMGERMRLLPAGGLTFNGDTAAANALDDYEEGTWTPAAGSGLTINSGSWAANGYYTKIGNIITLEVKQTSGNVSFGAGARILGGAPFTPGGTNGAAGCMTNTSPGLSANVLQWSSGQIYAAAAGSSQTAIRINITFRVD